MSDFETVSDLLNKAAWSRKLADTECDTALDALHRIEARLREAEERAFDAEANKDVWKQLAEAVEAERDRLRNRAKSVLWVFDGNATADERRAALESLRRARGGTGDGRG